MAPNRIRGRFSHPSPWTTSARNPLSRSRATSRTLTFPLPDPSMPETPTSRHRDGARAPRATRTAWTTCSMCSSEGSVRLDPVAEHLAELIDFGPDDGPAVRLACVLRVVVLVVRFGRVELREWHDLG